MIRVRGTVTRVFNFPAPRAAAFAHYAEFHRIFEWLSHVSLHQTLGDNQYLLRYQSVELGVYRISIYCYVQPILDRDAWIIRVTPLNDMPIIPTKTSWGDAQSQGTFASASIFDAQGDTTHITYRLNLTTVMKPPGGLRMVPQSVLEQIAQNITQRRMDQIAGSFIERSIASWVKEN